MVVNGNNDRGYCHGRDKEAEWMPVRAIVIRSVTVVSIRIIPAMTIVVAIGMMVIYPDVLVYPDVFTIINIYIDVFIAALDVGLITRVLNRFIATFYS